MIQVNMLKQKPVVHGIPSEKDSIKLYAIVTASVFVGALLTFGVLRLITSMTTGGTDTAGFVNVPVNTETTTQNTPAVAMVDSVKDDVYTQRVSSRYSEMSVIEQLNYEHVYAYYLFRELSLIVPSNVDFTNLSFSDFEYVSGMGGVDNKDGVVTLFSVLKEGNWSLEPKPASLFRSFVDGYQFRFKAGYAFKLNAEDVFIDESVIPSVDHLQKIKQTVSDIVTKSPVASDGKLELLDTKFEGKQRNYFYTIEGRSSFLQFREFLREIRMLKSPVSVSGAELEAVDGGMNWTVTVKITVM